jgi:hypothetical protein
LSKEELGVLHDLGREAGQPGHLEAEAFVGAARTNVVKKLKYIKII